MSISTIRSVAGALAATIAFAACGGHGLVPTQNSVPGFNAVTPMATNPCYTKAAQPAWIFKGSCVIAKLPKKGKTFKLAAYKGVTASIALPKNNSKGGPMFVIVDALGGKAKDITKYKGKSFPAIPKTAGKSVIYIQAVNSFAGLKFTSGSLVVTVTAKKLPGTKCAVALLRKTGAKLSWFTIPIAPTVSGKTITEKIPAGAIGTLYGQGLPAAPLYFNAACK
jgi:hypothetical protein